MKTKVFTDPFNRVGLIADNVEVVAISPIPRIKKNGELYRWPFAGNRCYTDAQICLLRLWEKKIVKADVIYPDGTHDVGVYVHIKDL